MVGCRWAHQQPPLDADPCRREQCAHRADQVPEAPTLGSAILGAVAAGLYPDIPTAAGLMVHERDRIEPNPEAHAEYQFYVNQYIDTYPRIEDLIHDIVRHEARR